MLLVLIVIAAVIVLSIYLTGMAMPKSYTVEKSAELDAPPNKIWLIITAHGREKEWRNGVREVEKQSALDRKPLWKESRYDRKHPLLLKTTKSEAPKRLEREIVDDKYISGKYTFQIEPAGEGSKLTVKQEIEQHKPFQRFKLNVFGSKTAEVDQYLSDLKQRVLFLKEDEDEESS